MIEHQPLSLSLYGPDGCGKSALARSIKRHLPEQDPAIIGASSYKDWLSDDIARRYTGAGVQNLCGTELYEAITVACYGYIEDLRNKGRGIIIDSDPYLKRMIWARTEMPTEQYEDYVQSFEERVSGALGELCGPSSLVVVELADCQDEAGSPEEHAAITQSRIQGRSIVTDFDPTTIDENLLIHAASTHVLNTVIMPRMFPRIPENPLVVVNGERPASEIDAHLAGLADRIITTFVG